MSEEKTRQPSRDEDPVVRVDDRRHWAREGADDDDTDESATQTTFVDELRGRAEAAEQKLQDYIAAFKESRDEQERFRERLSRDVDRRVELKFGAMIAEILEFLDDLDLALDHVEGVSEAEPLAQGVRLARDRFLGALSRHGVEKMKIEPLEPFDPNLAEAVEVEPVDSAEADGKVTKVIRAGFTLGDRVVRPARVAVGRHGS